MINRELIRIKIVQLTYAYYQNGDKNLNRAENGLLYSLSMAYSLYNYLLLLIVAISREMRHRVEVATNRATREGTEIPSAKFADNRFARQLESNTMLLDFVDEQKLTWDNDIEFVRRLCNLVEQSQIYQDYNILFSATNLRIKFETTKFFRNFYYSSLVRSCCT